MATSSFTSVALTRDHAAQLADTFKAERLASLSKNVESLLKSGKYTDVILQAGGKEFKAHKGILATSSPVFADMFDNENTVEAKKGTVEITDVSADVLYEVLCFIYTGQVQKMEAYASELLSAARKFKLDVLESYSEKYLSLSLDIVTVSSAKYRSTFPVTRLPDLALLCVFKQLPLAEQISARQVCTRWAVLVPESARRIRSLSLLVGAESLYYFEEEINYRVMYGEDVCKIMRRLINEDGTPMYPTCRLTEWNSLHYEVLNDDIVNQILATFTGITKLQFAGSDLTEQLYEHLIAILGHWRHQLATFKLFNLYNDELLSDGLTDRFFAVINSLSVLKSLTLDFGHNSLGDLSIVGQLVDISVSSNLFGLRSFFNSLQRYAQHNTALRIDVDAGPNLIELFDSFSDHLCARFVSFGSCDFPSTALEYICTRFRSLTTLSINWPVSLRHLFTSLSQLTELIYLSLYINFTKIEADHLEHLLLPQVNSIKALDLWVTVSSHLDLSQLHLARTMPNLQVINIDVNCSTCGIDTWCDDTTVKANPDKAKECFRQIFGSLKRVCPELCHIRHRCEDKLGTVEELLAE